MTKEEFFTALDELIRSDAGIQSYNLDDEILKLLEPDSSTAEYITYLAEYLVDPRYQHPNPKQTKILWYLANQFNNVSLIDALITLNGGKVECNLLVEILTKHWYATFEHAIYFYDNDITYSYNLIHDMVNFYEPPVFNTQAINNLLNSIKSKLITSDKHLNSLLYKAIATNSKMAEALIQHGCNPFSNYWNNHNIDTGIPILFAIVQTPYGYEFLKQHNDTQEWWNTTDKWERNLLHFVVKNKWPDKKFYDLLVEKGVDPDHRALIDNEEKVTLAKIKRTLPPEYGKTPRELLEERKQS